MKETHPGDRQVPRATDGSRRPPVSTARGSDHRRDFRSLSIISWDWCKTGGASACRIFSPLFVDRGWGVKWILKLAVAGEEGACVDILEISKPDELSDIANLGLTLTEAKQLLARVQREISTAQAREHAVRRPVCPCRDGSCRVKDYRDHAVATLFGQVTMRLPRFRCAVCVRIE